MKFKHTGSLMLALFMISSVGTVSFALPPRPGTNRRIPKERTEESLQRSKAKQLKREEEQNKIEQAERKIAEEEAEKQRLINEERKNLEEVEKAKQEEIRQEKIKSKRERKERENKERQKNIEIDQEIKKDNEKFLGLAIKYPEMLKYLTPIINSRGDRCLKYPVNLEAYCNCFEICIINFYFDNCRSDSDRINLYEEFKNLEEYKRYKQINREELREIIEEKNSYIFPYFWLSNEKKGKIETTNTILKNLIDAINKILIKYGYEAVNIKIV